MLLQTPSKLRLLSLIWPLALTSTTTFLISLLVFQAVQNYAMTGFLLGLFGLAALIGIPFALAIHQKFNMRQTLTVVTFVLSFIFLFYVTFTNLWQLALLRAVHGILFAFILAAVFLIRPDSKSYLRDFLIVIAPAFLGLFALFNFSIPFYLMFVVALTTSFLIFNLLPNSSIKPDSLSYLLTSVLHGFRKEFNKKLIPVFLALVAISALSNFLPIALAMGGFNVLSIGCAFAILLLPVFMLTENMREVLAKYGESRAIMFGLTTMVLALLLNSILFIPLLFYVTLFFFGLGFSLYMFAVSRNEKQLNLLLSCGAIFVGCFLGISFGFATFIGFFSLAVVLLVSLLLEVIMEWISSRRFKIEED